MSPRPSGFKPGSACGRAISTRRDTLDCRDTLAGRSARLIVTTACMCFRTLTRMIRGRIRSAFTRYGLRRGNYGASKLRRATRFTLTCGIPTLSQPERIPQPDVLADLPRLPRDEHGPVFAEP